MFTVLELAPGCYVVRVHHPETGALLARLTGPPGWWVLERLAEGLPAPRPAERVKTPAAG